MTSQRMPIMRVVRVGTRANLVLVRVGSQPIVVPVRWDAEASASGSSLSVLLEPEVAAILHDFTRERPGDRDVTVTAGVADGLGASPA